MKKDKWSFVISVVIVFAIAFVVYTVLTKEELASEPLPFVVDEVSSPLPIYPCDPNTEKCS